jgi:mannitol/fructose-specific phosphotransferase system IIA component (Ntr-type)
MLIDYISESNIRVGLIVTDWKDLVRVVGNVLVESDEIEPSYIDAMIKVIEDLGPYAVIAPGVVLLHARPEDGVKKMCVAIANLKEGINFGSANDPVRLAIALGAVDHHSHIELLKGLAELLSDKEQLSRLYTVNNSQEFIEILKTGQ